MRAPAVVVASALAGAFLVKAAHAQVAAPAGAMAPHDGHVIDSSYGAPPPSLAGFSRFARSSRGALQPRGS